jgi:hypothetical protein
LEIKKVRQDRGNSRGALYVHWLSTGERQVDGEREGARESERADASAGDGGGSASLEERERCALIV